MPEITDKQLGAIRFCLAQCKEKLDYASTIIDPYEAEDFFEGGKDDPEYDADSLIYGKEEMDWIDGLLESLPCEPGGY